MLLDLPICGGGELVLAILMSWLEGELVLYLVYLYLLFFSYIFFILTKVTLPHLLYWLVFT
jgi:hypothetical protein